MNLPSLVQRIQLSEFRPEAGSAESDLLNLFFRKLNIAKLGVFSFGTPENGCQPVKVYPNLACFKAIHDEDIAGEVPFSDPDRFSPRSLPDPR